MVLHNCVVYRFLPLPNNDDWKKKENRLISSFIDKLTVDQETDTLTVIHDSLIQK